MNGKEQDEDSKSNNAYNSVDDENEIKKEKHNFCRRLGRFAVKTPNNIFIIVTIVCLAIPGIVYFSKMTTSISYVFYTDKSAESTVAFENLLTDFGAGSSSPFMLLIVRGVRARSARITIASLAHISHTFTPNNATQL